MKWPLLVGWGITIYAIVYLAWSALVIQGLVDGIFSRVILSIVLIVVLFFATRSLHLHHWYDILPYSISWALIAVLFDFLCAVPVSGWGIWSDWSIWVGYAMVVFLPLFIPVRSKRTHTPHIS